MAKAKHTQQLDRISNNEVQLGLRTGAILSASKEAFSTNKLIRYTDDIIHIESPQALITKGYVDDAFDQLNKNITSALSIRIVPGKRIATEYNSGKETLEIGLGGAYIPDFSNKFLSETKTDKISYPVEALKAADDSYYYSYGVFTGQTDSKYGKFAASTADANAGMGAVISAIKVDKYGAVIGVDYKKISTSDLDNTGGAYDNYRAWVLNVGDQSVNVTGAANAPKDGEKPDANYGNTYELEFAGSGITPTISTSGTKHKVTFTPYLDQDYLTMVGAVGSANAKISHKLQSTTGQPLVSIAKILKGTVDAAGHITSVESVSLDDIAGDFDLKDYGTGSGESLEKGLVHGVDSAHTDNNPSTSTMFYTSNGKWAGIPYKEVKLSNAIANEDAPLVTGSDDITGLKKVNAATINPSTGELKAKSFTGDGSQITNINAASITTNVLNNKVIPTIPLEKGGLGRAITNSDLNSILAVKQDEAGRASITNIQTDITDGGSGSTYVLTQDRKNLENIKFTSINDLVDTELDNKNTVRIFATIGSADGSTYRVDGDGVTVNLQDVLAVAQYKKGYLFRATSNFYIKDSDNSKEYDYKVVSGDLIYAIKDYNEAGYPKFVVTPAYKGATKTEKSEINGNIKIDDTEYNVYELPEATYSTLGGVYVDSELSTNDNDVHVPKTSVVTSKINDVEASLNTKIDNVVNDLASKITDADGSSKIYADAKMKEHLEAENPHNITATTIGLDKVENEGMDAAPTKDSTRYVRSGGVYTSINAVDVKIDTVSATLNSHLSKINPHNVTASQVGLGSVKNYGITKAIDDNGDSGKKNIEDSNVDYTNIINAADKKYASEGLVISYMRDIYDSLNEGSKEFENLTVTGNLNVQGTTTTLATTKLEVNDQLVELGARDDKSVPLAGYAGVYVDTYNGDINNSKITALAFDDNGTAFVGHAKLDDNGLISGVDNDLQAIATRTGFGESDVIVKYCGNKKTLVPAVEGEDFLSNKSSVNAENITGIIGASVRYEGTPIEGVYLANINATNITEGDLSYDRISSLVSEAGSGDNGTSNTLARVDHTHSDIKKIIDDHLETDNPHNITAETIGLDKVVNASMDAIPTNQSENYVKSGGVYAAIHDALDQASGATADVSQKLDIHIKDTTNPHNVTKAQVGLGLVVNAEMDAIPTNQSENYVKSGGVYAAIHDALDQTSGDAADVNQKLYAHIKDITNPHNVTKAQVGLDKVENLSIDSVVTENSKNYISSGAVFTSVNKVEVAVSNVKSNLDTLTSSFNVTASKVESHISSYNNPHKVSKAQVGLGSVENYGITKASDIYTDYGSYKLSSLNDLTEESITTYDSKYASAGLVTAYAKKLYEASKGDQSFKNVSIEGNLNVQGNVTSLETTNLEIKDQMIELDKRNDKSVPLAGYAGLYVDAYNGDLTDQKAAALAFDANGIAYAGHVKIDSNGMISDDENDLQILATRTGFGESDVIVKYCGNKKTLVPAIESEDYLSKNSTLNADKLIGIIGDSVRYEGYPIDGQYLENIDAATITKGDLAYERISSLVSEAGSGDNGTSNTLARVDHTHSDIKKIIDEHTADKNNPHNVTKTQVGLDKVVNAEMDNLPTNQSENYVKSGGVYSEFVSVNTSINAVSSSLKSHTDNKNNPHNVTKAQVGLGLVVNASMDAIPTNQSENYVKSGGVYAEFVSVNTSINAVSSSLKSHTDNKNNPHNVTASQVGLGLVVNASMDSDPIKNSNNYVRSGGVYNSIANVNASISTLENKVDTHIDNKQNPHGVTKNQVGLGSVENASMLHSDSKKALQNISEDDITATDPKYASAGLVTAYVKDLYNHITGDQQFTNVVITGNLNVQGNVTSLETTNLEIKDQMIELDKRKDKSVPLAGYAGLYVDTYNGDTANSKAVALAFDNNGIAYVGHAKLDENGLIPIDSEDNNLQPIATRKGFENLSSDVMVKYKTSEKTLVPAQDGTDYLSGNSILKAENLRGVIGASVEFKGSPIDGDYLTNIDASTITRGDLDFARVESITPARNDSDKSTVDYGIAEQLARIDHKHSEYLTEASEIELAGDVTGKGPIGKPIVTLISDGAVTTSKIADGNVTNAKIESLNPNKINKGIIGAADKVVDLYGNARTASNLAKEKSKGVLYQSSTNTTDSVEGIEDQVLLQGTDKPKWTDQKNIVAGSINGGKANDLLYQSDANKTSFLNAPTSAVQNTLTYSGNHLTWVNTNTLHVEEAAQAVTVCVNNGANDEIFLVGTTNENGFQTPKSSTIKAKSGKLSIGNNSIDGIIAVGASGSSFRTEVKANVNAMNSKPASSGLGANINVYLPSEDGNIDTVEMRNKKLEEYLPLIGGTLTGKLNINASSPQLHIVNTSANNENKTSKITTSTYTNEILNIVETIATESTNSIYVGGNGINGIAADSILINIAEGHDSLSKKTVVTINKSAINLGDSINIIPGKSTNIGLSSNLVENIYAKNYFENNVNIATIYPRTTADKTGNTTPILVASEDSASPDTVITSVSIEDGKLNYTKGILPVDDMVKQNYVNDGTLRPLLLANTNGITNASGVRTDVDYNNSIYVNPINSELFVKSIKSSGSTPTQLFGNASTATKASAVYDDKAETSATRIIVATSVVENRTTNNTPNTLVERDSAGDFAANNITVEELKSGKTNGKTHLVGLADEATLAYDANNAYALKSKDGSKTRSSDVIIAELEAATNINNGGTIVKRDAKGNFSATVITAALSGNASTATKLETSRNFSVTGGATSDTVKFDGSADVNINVKTVQPNIIVSGTIGTSSAKVDLVGNASTATIASNLAGGKQFSIPYQSSASTTAYIDWLKDSDLPSESSEFILLATDKTKSPKWSKNPYLHLNGVDTMTGILNVATNKNAASYDSHAINMNRSNIGNLHGIFFEQTYDSTNNGQETVLTAKENTVDQGIHFFSDNTHVDTLYSKSGKLLYSPNRELGSETHTDYDIIHSGNHMKYIANVNIKDLGSNVENISNININEVGVNNSQNTILTVSRGGTGVSSIAKNSIIIGNGNDPVKEILIGSSRQFLRVNASTDGYEFVNLGTMAYQDTDKYKGNEVIESVGTITKGTWNANRILMDYLDANVNTHINNSEGIHLPTATDSGFVLISDASNNRKWTNDIRIESDRVQINKKLNVNGDLSVTGNMSLGGGITIAGSTTIVDATTLSTTDMLIELGKGNTKEITTYAGFYIPNYDGKNAGALAFDKNGIAYVGDAFINANGFIDSNEKKYDSNGKLTAGNDMRPIAVRDTSIDDNSIIKWNASTKSLVKAEAGKDYVPVANVSAGNYYKVVTNEHGLVTSGESSLDINDKNITGNLPASRINYTANAEGAQETTVDLTLNDIYEKLNKNANVPTQSINVSGDIVGSGTINEGLVLSIKNGAVTNEKIESIDPSKITTGTIGSSTVTVNLAGNATTATNAKTAENVKITSGTSGNILVGRSGDSVGLVATNISVSGSTITGTATNAIQAEYLHAAIPSSANVDIFYANSNDKTLGIQTTNGIRYALDLNAAKIVKGSTNTELITSDNVATKTLSRFRLTSKYAGSATVEVNISNNILPNASVTPVDISNLLPGDEQYNGKYVSVTTSQNIPALKSFGEGLILGKDTTSGTNTAFKEDQEGCKMIYNKTKKCVQFIFQ